MHAGSVRGYDGRDRRFFFFCLETASSLGVYDGIGTGINVLNEFDGTALEKEKFLYVNDKNIQEINFWI